MGTDTIQKTRNRIYYFDVLRCISCMAVIMIHTSALYIIKDFGSFNYWVGNIFDSIVRFGVPIFVMISGSLMLDEGYDYNSKKSAKHIKKMALFFVFWSAVCALFYQIVKPVITHEQISINEIIEAFIKGSTHLWFVFMIIGLYLILPLLRLWVKKENKKQIEYFLTLSVIFAFIVPQICRIGSNYSSFFESISYIIEKLNIKYVGGYTTYFILGWYINNFGFKNKKLIYAGGVLCLLATIAASTAISVTTGEPELMYEAITFNVLVYSAMIFTLVKDLFGKKGAAEGNKLVLSMSKYSLGIYAIHPIIISLVSNVLLKFGIDIAIINIPVTFAVTLVVSYVASFIMSKIPVLKKIV